MAENSAIEWTEHTFNIAWGCDKVSPACKHCYAESLAKRYGFDVWGKDKPRRVLSDAYWREPLKWNKAAEKAGKAARVFCSSMADVFEDHPTLSGQRARLWPLIKATPWLKWLLLTKRPENVARMMPAGWWPENVHAGFTAENQDWFDQRSKYINTIPVPWFVSYEPALGPVDFRGLGGVSWLIVGGESGHGAREMPEAWVRSARDQAVAAGVAFFYKQRIEGGRKISLPLLGDRQWSEVPR